MPDVGTLPVISLDVLNADECARWSERVLALKSQLLSAVEIISAAQSCNSVAWIALALTTWACSAL